MMWMARRFCALFLCSFALLFGLEGEVHAQAIEVREVDIPSQSLDAALRQLANALSLQILFLPEDVKGMTTKGIKGRYAPQEAAERLIEGTGLVAVSNGKNAITIKPASARPSQGEGIHKGESIVVTGSNIRGNTYGASPVQILDRTEIERRGYASVPDLLSSIPQNFSTISGWRVSVGDLEQAGNIGKATGINLRGLGARSTLVLINGRRVAPTGLGSFVDVSAIPIAAIERVEILGDGASAIYGSDAVAGVVNFVLKKPANAAETIVKMGRATSGGFEQFNLGQTVGRTWDGGGVLLAADILKNTDLGKDERDFSRSAPSPAPLVPRSRQHSVVGNVRQDIGTMLTVFGDIIYASRKASNFDTGGVFLDVDKDSYTATAGAFAELARAWQLEASVSTSKDNLRRITVNAAGVARPITQTSDAAFGNVKVNGQLMSLPGGDVRTALGAEMVELSQLNNNNGRILTDQKTTQQSVFAEVLVPLIGPRNVSAFAKSINVTAAVRRDDYNAFGSVSNPKLGLVWDINDRAAVRSTWGTAFRTPLLNEVTLGGMASFVTNVPDPGSPTGMSRTLILTGSNPSGLRPEESTSWTAGFDLRPIAGASMSATYFNYDYTDRIDRAATSANAILANPTIYAPFLIANPTVDQINAFYAQSISVAASPGLTTAPSSITRVADLRSNNVGRTRVSGIDTEMRYAWSGAAARWTASVGGTYYINFRNTPVAGGESVPASGISFSPSNFRGRVNLGYQTSSWTADATVNYVAGYKDVFPTQPDRRVEAWAPVDLRIAHRLADLSGSPAEIALLVRNALDEPPPFVRDLSSGGPRGFDAANADPVGRMVFIELRYRW